MPKPSLLSTPLGRLRLVALSEGFSFVTLLAIAMPLKYMAGYPGAVQVTGVAHGLLFLLFVLTLLHATSAHRWKLSFSGLVFLSSLVPLGAFFMDRRLRRLEAGR